MGCVFLWKKTHFVCGSFQSSKYCEVLLADGKLTAEIRKLNPSSKPLCRPCTG